MDSTKGFIGITRDAAWFAFREFFRPIVLLARFFRKDDFDVAFRVAESQDQTEDIDLERNRARRRRLQLSRPAEKQARPAPDGEAETNTQLD